MGPGHLHTGRVISGLQPLPALEYRTGMSLFGKSHGDDGAIGEQDVVLVPGCSLAAQSRS